MEDNKTLLTEAEVFDTLLFAKKVSESSMMSPFGVYTPDMVNSVLKHINMNPEAPNDDRLGKALSNPNQSEDELVKYSEFYNVNDMTYKRITNYLAGMLAFDLSVTCKNASGAEYNSKEYKEDLKRVYKFLDKINYKREFGKIVKNMIRQETVFSVLRDDAMSYALQQLPSEFCKITGNSTIGTMLFDFNMYYFMRPAVDINSYPDIFKEYYMEVFSGDGDNNYIPSNPLNSRIGEFVMWHQTSPLDGFWVWKFSPEIYTKIPYLTPMMKDIQRNDLIRELQKNKDVASAFALVMGEIGFIDANSGKKADALNISPTTLATFMQLVKSGLDNFFKFGGLPLANLKQFQFEDKNPNMYENQIRNTAGKSVSMSRAIYATDKLSQTEAEILLHTDGNLMKALYSQFNDFLNLFANKKTKKFKFDFEFEGLEYPIDRAERLSMALDLADRGIVLPQKIQTAVGMTPQSFDRMLEEGKYSKFSEKLTSLISIHTANGDGSKPETRKRKRRVSTESRDYDDSN